MKILITGGAGFIGCNAARHYADAGHDVLVVDTLSRPGSDLNLAWLGDSVRFEKQCVRGLSMHTLVRREKPDVILHLAAQTAVTWSVDHPMFDFHINAFGTMNLLEAVRMHAPDALFLFASTNKVYGGDPVANEGGVDETCPLDFHSPYGCSKGCADQYVRDYARIYGLKTAVFRQSCIYGPRQFGVEDQGWVAWFVIAAELGLPITIYGNGEQVRDLLYIDDLLALYDEAIDSPDVVSGKVYNVGGGKDTATSLRGLLAMLTNIYGYEPKVSYADARPGDQQWYVSDIDKARHELGWIPQVSVADGLRGLVNWDKSNRDALEEMHCVKAEAEV